MSYGASGYVYRSPASSPKPAAAGLPAVPFGVPVPAAKQPYAPPARESAPPVRQDPAPAPRPVREEPPVQQSLFGEPETDPAKAPVRLVGEVMRTYILAEQGDSMIFIDKHAAHERMNFDRLKAQGRRIMSQGLLTPEIWRAGTEDRELITENRALLEELGFELEPFGEDDILVRGVPDTLDPAQTIPALEEICGELRRGRRDIQRDEILKTISCKSAIKAGWDTDPSEMQVLVEKVASGEIRYCPHGRPVAFRLTRKELDKQFRRIV